MFSVFTWIYKADQLRAVFHLKFRVAVMFLCIIKMVQDYGTILQSQQCIY